MAGSGKFGTPWERMQLTNWSIAFWLASLWLPPPSPAGCSDLHAWEADLNADELGSRSDPLVTFKLNLPLLPGSGKSGTPCARMHCEYCSALFRLAVCAEPELPPDPVAELAVELVDELPPQPARATTQLAKTTAMAPAAPRRRVRRGGGFVFSVAWALLIIVIVCLRESTLLALEARCRKPVVTPGS